MLDLESEVTLWAFSSLSLESESVVPGASSVRDGGWSTGRGMAGTEESGASPLSSTSLMGGVAADEEITVWKEH